MNENDILTTLEEIYENEKLSDDKCNIKKIQELNNFSPTKNNKDCEMIEKVLISKIDDVITDHETSSVFEHLNKRKCTFINPEKQVVSGLVITSLKILLNF